MKLRVRPMASKDTLKVEVPSNCTLPQLKQEIANRIGAAASPLILSLNRKDQLSGAADDTLQSLGVASGDLLFYTVDSGIFVPKTPTLTAESSGTNQRIELDVTVDEIGVIDCGKSETLIEGSDVNETRIEDAVMAEDAKSVATQTVDLKTPEMSSVELNPVEGDMDIGNLGSDVVSNRLMKPYFLKNVLKEGQGGHCLLVAAVDAVLVDSGFVRLDSVAGVPVYGFDIPDKRISSVLSLRYTLDELITSESTVVAGHVVVVKLQEVGRYLMVYGALGGGKNGCHTVKLDESHFASQIQMFMSGEDGKDLFLEMLPESEVFKFYKEVKDKLALPLLIDLCDKAGLPLPPCLMLLPTEMKLKILELVAGADLARMACVCSEMQYLTTDNSLWKRKYEEEFGNAVENTSALGSWKQRFVTSWQFAQARKRGRQRAESLAGISTHGKHYVPRRHPRPFGGNPFIIGGHHDLIPGGPGPFGNFPSSGGHFVRGGIGSPLPNRHRNWNFSPGCNLGGGL